MSKHTPGPWDQRYFDDAKVIVVGPKKGQGTKRTLVATLTGPEREANGNLLVAAPDLLEALSEVIDLFEWKESGGPEEQAYDKAVAAIAKAEGGGV